MITIRTLFGQIQVTVNLVLFAGLALAALQNVTVDDAVSTGAVVPQYLPSESAWHQGNNCSGCAVRPDPALAYNGTWHDTTLYSGSGTYQTMEFSFVGSAVYIYFILANTVPPAGTATDVTFTLDGVTFPPFVHSPSTSTDYEYNVPVFVNKSLTFGTHTMIVEPVDTGHEVLILFDYLIYTTDTDNITTTTSTTPTPLATPSSSPSSISPGASGGTPPGTSLTSGTSSRPNIGAIVGGTVAGLGAFALVTASLLCYRRYKRHTGGQSPLVDLTAVEPFTSQVAPMSFEGSSPPMHQSPVRSSVTQPGSRRKTNTSPVTAQPSTSPPSVTPTSSGASSNNIPGLLEQVGLLRGEVARLRELQNQDHNLAEFGSEAPPEYA